MVQEGPISVFSSWSCRWPQGSLTTCCVSDTLVTVLMIQVAERHISKNNWKSSLTEQIISPSQGNKDIRLWSQGSDRCVCGQSCPTLWDPMDYVLPGSPSMGYFRKEFWSGLPFPPPGYLPNPGIKPASPASPSLAGRFFTTEQPGKPNKYKIPPLFIHKGCPFTVSLQLLQSWLVLCGTLVFTF